MIERIEKILEFWFGAFPDAWSGDAGKADMWFKNGSACDMEIFTTFGADYQDAIEGNLDHWAESPRGRLALIILFDQFSRHIHRNSADAFAQDLRAQELCVDGIGAGDDLKLHPVERSFFYLPLEHAEDIGRQNLGLQAFAGLMNDVPESHRKPFEDTLDWARKHHYVIERFGRFPELNEILGRVSTEEEVGFINDGKYAFL